ncbi:helix-turn-helix domain-containing protein [Streptomyces sp. SID3343]|uniref:helix-turn-helix domain-containing protein n=1 Tax=Streptomyces sp. SID3343 TaxID=2690260 RepID=UPI001367CD19|nr:helix-turn-helix domain-containing protein [Streptomyces sp. SID3343]MYW06512.1 helix-turn-helix domain-containing protein [Streptomyces sp. SID3343]
MDSAGAGADDSRGAFSLDTITPLPRGFTNFVHDWETQVGDGFPLPTFSPDTTGDFRVKGRAAKVGDVAITDLHGASALRTADPGDDEDRVRIWLVRRGAWTLGGGPGPDHGGERTISAGQFLVRHVGRPVHFETAPHTTAKVVVLPTAMLEPLLGNRILTGSTDSAEVRLLVAHTNMIHATVTDLGPAGLHAAHSALIELAKAVARHRFDDREPLLAPALAQAAKDLADSRLADPSLSSRTLASELNVSVRTLQRAFAAGGESVTAYIRLRRLEEARLALTARSGRPSVSELAARWQFSDSSHFIRAFKAHYGRTPTDYAREASSPRA